MTDILFAVVRLMSFAGSLQELTGHEKKEYVVSEVLMLFDMDEDKDEFVRNIIDVLIKVEKKELIFNKHVVKTIKKWFC